MISVLGWLSGAFAWLSASVTAVFAFFGLQLSKKVLLVITSIAFFISLTVAFWSALKTALLAIAVVTPNEIIIASTWFIPDNFGLIISTYLSMILARALYDMKQHFLQMKLF